MLDSCKEYTCISSKPYVLVYNPLDTRLIMFLFHVKGGVIDYKNRTTGNDVCYSCFDMHSFNILPDKLVWG